MDIEAMSVAMHQASLQNAVSRSLMKMRMDNQAQSASEMTNMAMDTSKRTNIVMMLKVKMFKIQHLCFKLLIMHFKK